MVRKPLHAGLLAAAGLFTCSLMVVVSPAVPAVASGQVCAGVVIDDGNGGAPAVQAGQVPPGASDLNILSAAGDSFNPNDAGLICAINGYPADGVQNCLNTANGLFYYWSYWEGDPTTNTWTYGSIGPAEHTVTAGQNYVEGWRYQNPGPDSPSAPKPSVSPAAAFAAACPAASSAPAPGGGGVGGVIVGGGSAGGAASSAGGSFTPSAVPASPTTAGTGTGSGGAAAAPGSAPGAPGSPTAPGATTTTTRGTAGPNRRHAGGSTPATATSKPGGAQHSKSHSKQETSASKLAVGGAGAHHGSGGGGNPALPIVVVAVIIALLGAGAWFRWRRRPGEV